MNVCRYLKSNFSHASNMFCTKTLFLTKLYNIRTSGSLQYIKRTVRSKKKLGENEVPGLFKITAYSTASEYNLEGVISGLHKEGLYKSNKFDSNPDVLHAYAKYQVASEPREIFFFREGSVVFWNISDLESSNVLSLLKSFEKDSYADVDVLNEAEQMNYYHDSEVNASTLDKDGNIQLNKTENVLEKYTFSNAIALSVKLGIWEACLDKYIDTIESLTEDLRKGNMIKITQEEALRKHGELFSLRHMINLSSDLLDTPDFYWDREALEKLYLQMYAYFSIARRTRVVNEKINHCTELIELLSGHLSDKHHVRLEVMIIILIMVEVFFECIHYVERFLI